MKTRSSATRSNPLHFRIAPLAALRALAERQERTVLINLHGVTSIDSQGIALLMEARQQITAQGGDLVLFGVHDEVRRIFETARLDRVFRIFSTREEALADQFGFSFPTSPSLN